MPNPNDMLQARFTELKTYFNAADLPDSSLRLHPSDEEEGVGELILDLFDGDKQTTGQTTVRWDGDWSDIWKVLIEAVMSFLLQQTISRLRKGRDG